MVRPKWENRPDDQAKLQDFIDRLLNSSASDGVKDLLRHEKQRDLDIISIDNFNMKSVIDKVAAALHQRGNLVLPRPTGRFREKAEIWESELRKLDERNMRELQNCPVTDLHGSFQVFKEQETRAWGLHHEYDMPTQLVEPSGSLDSSLSWRMNQLWNFSLGLEKSEIADLTANGFRVPGTILIICSSTISTIVTMGPTHGKKATIPKKFWNAMSNSLTIFQAR
ncbi:uncharacterized protein TRUGW13939_05212 [Talaromyces rugulosus]|uniref:Uncharacterized protein n=1 Tax=Talaromyces rugulosus TaxID=121627 RepID=A0A7H8QXC5_TALRU|nr:uncharacterized protein TRUGW13939_05212 [Talaromyces rugulosus]QKX58091.1 hypothetical protein TRUGW13939_05212 [Talaromyces rugulosus]